MGFRIPSCSPLDSERVDTTFWEDFTTADIFGLEAVKDTYNRSLESFKSDIKYMTELYMVLNHKIWQQYEVNEPLARVYDELWRKCGNYIDSHFNKKDLSWFYSIID